MVGLLGCGCCGAAACPPSPAGWGYVSLPQSNATSCFCQEQWNSVPTLNGDWHFCATQTVNGVLRQFGGTSLLFKLTDPPNNNTADIFTRADYSWDWTIPQVPSVNTNSVYSQVWTGPVINWNPASAKYGWSFIIRYELTAGSGGPSPGLNFGTKSYYFRPWNHQQQCATPTIVTETIPGAVFTTGSYGVTEFWVGTAISETVEAYGNWNASGGVWDVELKVGGVVKIKANGTIPSDRTDDKACFGEMLLNGAAFVPFSSSPSPTLPTHDNTLIRYTY